MVKDIKSKHLHSWWLYLLALLFSGSSAISGTYWPIKSKRWSCQRLLKNLTPRKHPVSNPPSLPIAWYKKHNYCRQALRTSQKNFHRQHHYTRSFLPFIGGLVVLNIWIEEYEAAPLSAEEIARRQKIAQIWKEEYMPPSMVPQNVKVKRFRKFARYNFRENVKRYYGHSVPPAGKDAHHIFPAAFERKFNKAGIAIHHPAYGIWWEKYAHRRKSGKYNSAWKKFFHHYEELGEAPSYVDIFEKGRKLLEEYQPV